MKKYLFGEFDDIDVLKLNNTDVIFINKNNHKLIKKIEILGLVVIYLNPEVDINNLKTNYNFEIEEENFSNDLLNEFKALNDIYGSVVDKNKFQKTMEKEANKLLHAENREKYKQNMRKNSLSNKKISSSNKSVEEKTKKK